MHLIFSPPRLRFLFCALMFCVSPVFPDTDEAPKIGFDLSALDAEGLRGAPEGKVAVDYEFCIPDTPERRAQVLSIDSSVKFMPGSRGRIGCGPGTVLCIGNTHQPNAVAVLQALAALPWIHHIQECVWE